jgi:hypothetical protein
VESRWHENLSFGTQWVICDQLAMAVVLNNKVVKKSHDCFVSSNDLFHDSKIDAFSAEKNGNTRRKVTSFQRYCVK